MRRAAIAALALSSAACTFDFNRTFDGGAAPDQAIHDGPDADHPPHDAAPDKDGQPPQPDAGPLEVLDHPVPLTIYSGAAMQVDTAVAFDGTNYLVVWADNRAADYDIRGTLVTPTGQLGKADFSICQATAHQEMPAVAFDKTASQYLVIWRDNRLGYHRSIYGVRLRGDGTKVDASDIQIADDTAGERDYPAIATGGLGFLVAWQDTRTGNQDIHATRVTNAGTVLPESTLAAGSQSKLAPAVGFDGTRFLVVWADDRMPATDYDIYGARVDTNGSVVDASGLKLVAKADPQFAPTLAFAGGNYLLVWQHREGASYQYTIQGVLVSPAGQTMGQELDLSTTAGVDNHTVAAHGSGFLVAWDEEATPQGRNIRAARVTLAGSALDPGGVVINATTESERPAIAWDWATTAGDELLVVWQENVNLTEDVYGARVRP